MLIDRITYSVFPVQAMAPDGVRNMVKIRLANVKDRPRLSDYIFVKKTWSPITFYYSYYFRVIAKASAPAMKEEKLWHLTLWHG